MIFKQAAAAMVAVAALSAGSALADEGPISTASTTSAPSADQKVAEQPAPVAPARTTTSAPQSIDAQIADYLATSPVARPPSADDYDTASDDAPDRKMHGEVSVGVGSHGYRSFYGRSDIPVGKTGTLSIAVGETRGRGLYGYGYGPYGGYPYGGYGYGYGRGGPSRTLGLSFYSGDVIHERETRRCRYGEDMGRAADVEADCKTIYSGPPS